MDIATPYSPPRAALDSDEALAAGVPWRIEGCTLYVRNGTTLPDVCIFTGEPTTPEQRVERALTWTPRWFAVAWVVATALALFTYSYFRRIGTIHHGLGEAGRKRRKVGFVFALATALVAIAIIAAPFIGDPELVWGAAALPLVVSIVGIVRYRLFRVTSIDRHYIRIQLTLPAAQALAPLAPRA